ncbi:MAG: excinuclease ABC subunit UvrB [Patescibacteria group bacterium]|nr:excinuclease ABC subunit UvrB [Patescibacteria group bacterium]MCL5257983.1 excinuclease ABC subunit UvrB [Patescibacteria group bacterium]
MFKLKSQFEPTGDQPKAIKNLVKSVRAGNRFQTLLGVTGSGKTFTMASMIESLQRPALIISPNKVLAAQLYQEFSSFFPENAVNFFVSYYDYYQPEAYLPTFDTYIAKDARINEFLDQLRHATLQSALTRQDFVIISSVSCIYGLGHPDQYEKVGFDLKLGDKINKTNLAKRLKILQYQEAGRTVRGGSFKIADWSVDIILPDGRALIQIWLDRFGLVESIRRYPVEKKFEQKFSLDVVLESFEEIGAVKIYPAKFFVAPREKIELAILNIRQELDEHYWKLLKEDRLVEAERLKQRTLLDLELLEKNGYCSGIENYSRHLSFRQPGQPPYTLFDYLPDDTLVFIDESHLALPQIRSMASGDRRRKEALIEYGWRLPSALDNRPLTEAEFLEKKFQTVFVSATPAQFERRLSSLIAEQLVRPTFIPDPIIEVRSSQNQIVDLIREINMRTTRSERALVLTVTKRAAENLCEFLLDHKIKAHYLHADVKTFKRAEIIKKLRQGEIEVLVGINLLREGLDLPEVSLVVILDADKEGFLRNETTLIQAIGRASRHLDGRVIFYADKMTESMARAISESERRRRRQVEFNRRNKIKPKAIIKEIQETILTMSAKPEKVLSREELTFFLEEEKNVL